MTEVYLNGKYMWDIENSEEFVNTVKAERRR